MTTYRHVLALNPYFGDSIPVMGLFPATGLEYIAASMKDLVGRVTLLDLRHEPRYQDPRVLGAFIRAEIDLVCVSIRWHTQFRRICEFVAQLPPEVPMVVGGYQATLEVEELFAACPNVRVVVRGEGEDTIRQIVTGVPYEQIRGISYRRDGQIVHNENQALPDLTHMPFPDRSLRRHPYHLWQNGVQLTRRTFDTILTTRGCPFKCKFCTFSLNPLGQKREYTERPLASVIAELQTIEADVVLFSDDNLCTNIRRSEELCDLIVRHGIRKTFVVQTRVDIAKHPRLLDKAWAAGFRLFLLGIESPHDRILEQMHKGITQQGIRDAMAVLARYDFFLHGYFIYGNVGETEEEMLYIARFAREIGLDTISFQKLRIEKHSPLKELVDSTPGYYYERIGGAVYSDRFDRAAFKRISRRIRAGFYTPGRILHIARKAHRLGFYTVPEALDALVKLPLILWRQSRERSQKKKRPRPAPLGPGVRRSPVDAAPTP